MTGRTQKGLAVLGWVAPATWAGVSPPVLLGGALVAGATSMIADLDHDESMAKYRWPGGRALTRLVHRLGFSRRGALHAFPAAPLIAGLLALVPGLIWGIPPLWVAPAVVVGYCGGVLPDAVTESGIPLRPRVLGRSRLRLGSLKVEGTVDTLLGWTAPLLTLWIALSYLAAGA